MGTVYAMLSGLCVLSRLFIRAKYRGPVAIAIGADARLAAAARVNNRR